MMSPRSSISAHHRASLFHQSEDAFREAAVRYVESGLAAGAAVITITTNDHRATIVDALTHSAVDVAGAFASGQLLMLDAREIICAVLRDDAPDPQRFDAIVTKMIERIVTRRRRASLRVLSEMVDVLVQTGRVQAASTVDSMWGELGRRVAFDLLSAHGVGEEARHAAITAAAAHAKALRREAERPSNKPVSGERPRVRRGVDLAAVTHELRGTLNAIHGWATLLQESVDDPAATTAVDAILRNVHLQTRLLDDVRDAAEIEDGTLALDVAPVDLAAVVRTALAAVTPSATVRSTVLTFVGPASAPFVGDGARLTQAVESLLSIALKNTARGGSIEVRVEAHSATFVLAIDDGQSESGAAPAYQRDLALANARSIVELHRGEVTCTGGATFVVRLPRSTASATG